MRLLLATAVTIVMGLLIASPAAAAPRDPGYQRVLDSYKAKKWTEFDALTATFLTERPDFKFAHSVRFMVADSLRQRKRLREAADALEQYLELHPAASLADRSRGALISVLNADRRYEAAVARARDYLERFPMGKSAELAAFEFGAALEGLRKFDAAAAAYLTISGTYLERARYRRGAALFRGRRFPEARRALENFIEVFPESTWVRPARDYLFRADAGFKVVKDGVVLDYSGKYEGDERVLAVRERLPSVRRAALERIERVLGRPPPEGFLVRFADAGSNRSGLLAQTRLEVSGGTPHQVLILHTEFLATGAHDLQKTVTHELYHCLQRELLGEAHFRTPRWVREGAAMYVAGQAEERMATIAAEKGRRRSVSDPMARLVNGLGGRHTFDDYAEDVAAFLWVEETKGRKKVVALLRALLETSDTAAAVSKTLGMKMDEFERGAAAWTRRRLQPIVARGRAEYLAAMVLLGRDDYEGALEKLTGDLGAYTPAAAYYRAVTLMNASRLDEALAALRTGFLKRHRTYAPLLDNALLLEVRLLKDLGRDEFGPAAERARRDLEPTLSYKSLVRLLAD